MLSAAKHPRLRRMLKCLSIDKKIFFKKLKCLSGVFTAKFTNWVKMDVKIFSVLFSFFFYFILGNGIYIYILIVKPNGCRKIYIVHKKAP